MSLAIREGDVMVGDTLDVVEVVEDVVVVVVEVVVIGNWFKLSVSTETDELWEDIWMELPPEIETI